MKLNNTDLRVQRNAKNGAEFGVDPTMLNLRIHARRLLCVTTDVCNSDFYLQNIKTLSNI